MQCCGIGARHLNGDGDLFGVKILLAFVFVFFCCVGGFIWVIVLNNCPGLGSFGIVEGHCVAKQRV